MIDQQEMARLKATAIHEAGHFVASYRIGRRLHDHLSIQPDHDEGTAGRLMSEESHWTPEEGREEVTILCAGYAALVAAGFTEEQAALGCDGDFWHAEDIIGLWGLEPIEVHKARTVETMRLPGNIAAVERLAKELLLAGRVEGELAEVLIDVSDGETTEAELEQFLQFRYGSAPITGK